MRKKGYLVVMLMLSLLVVSFIPPAVRAQEEPNLEIAVAIAPLGGIIKRVGGGYLDISVILPEGVEPHASQLPTEAVERANQADLLALTGHFAFEDDLVSQTDVPYITLHDENAFERYSDYGAELSPIPRIEEEGEENPHAWWLLPRNAASIANTTVAALNRIEGGHSQYWNLQLNTFLSDLQAFVNFVDTQKEEYSLASIRAIGVFPAEAYVAEAFGIEIVTILQEEGTFVSGTELVQVQDALENGSVDVIIGSDVARLQNAGEFAQQLTEDYGTPLIWVRGVFVEGLSDYLSIMTYNLGAVTSGLENTDSPFGPNTLNLILLAGVAVLGIISLTEGILLYQKSKAD
ncbi:MAG: metal ABC transporter substrate-binding protein [Promethearchaeia archaeon]